MLHVHACACVLALYVLTQSCVSFDLGTPISLEEAIFSLDYIDHDFYVFRDIDTKEINVVYKRNAGGVGLIQPQA